MPDTQSSLLLCMDGLVVGDLLIVPLLDLKEPFNDESCPGNTVVTGKSVPDPQVDGQIPAIISVMNYRGFPLVILKRNICFKARILMFKGVYAIYPSIFTLVK